MSLKKISQRNYKSIVNRGLITKSTTFDQFMDKLYEEVKELYIETPLGEGFNEELADVILTVLNIAYHYNIDIHTELINKIIKNEKR